MNTYLYSIIKKSLILVLFLIELSNASAQSITEIKTQSDKYLWGEATNKKKKRADQEALAELVSQISTTVESSFSLSKKEVQKKRRTKYREEYNSAINSYSHATLRNAQRIVKQNNGLYTVFRYIERSEVKKIFDLREERIKQFVHNGNDYLNKLYISDALKYYYWALLLLQSHPDGNSIFYIDNAGDSVRLSSWLPLQMNNIFSGISFSFEKNERRYNTWEVSLYVTYYGKPISSFYYRYLNPYKWTRLMVSQDSRIYLNISGYGVFSNTSSIELYAEYIIEPETYNDPDEKALFDNTPAIDFEKSIFTILDPNTLNKEEIQNIANSVGAKLMKCCSSGGGDKLKTEVIWENDFNGRPSTRYSSKGDKLFIKMKVNWYGSITGFHYYILGTIEIDLETGHKTWRKEKDSGWFPPNCGSNCDINKS